MKQKYLHGPLYICVKQAVRLATQFYIYNVRLMDPKNAAFIIGHQTFPILPETESGATTPTELARESSPIFLISIGHIDLYTQWIVPPKLLGFWFCQQGITLSTFFSMHSYWLLQSSKLTFTQHSN